MVGKAIREVRCDDVLSLFVKENKGVSFMTLTTPDVVTIHEIRKRWTSLRHYLVEFYGKDTKYVMNYELHPGGHGWHIHSVWNRFVPLWNGRLSKMRSYGFGMVNIKKVSTKVVSQYLTKHCLKAYRGVKTQLKLEGGKRLRLVNSSRGLPVLSDYSWRSPDLDKAREILKDEEFLRMTKSLGFVRRAAIAETAAFEELHWRQVLRRDLLKNGVKL